MESQDKKQATPKGGQAWWQPALVIFAKFSGWIAVPLILGLYIGKWLDKKYGTAPWLFLGSVGVAFAISMVGLVITVMKDYKRIEKESKDKSGKNNDNT